MRPPTEDEIDQLRHDILSLSVRAGRPMEVVRVSCPADIDRDALVRAVNERLARTTLGAVEVWLTDGDGVRVVGGVFG